MTKYLYLYLLNKYLQEILTLRYFPISISNDGLTILGVDISTYIVVYSQLVKQFHHAPG